MYLFLDLPHKEVESLVKINEIFNTSEDLLKKKFTFIGNDFDLLNQILEEEEYYVLHDNIIVKGKKRILKGKIVISDKLSILSYLNNAFNNNDVRPIRIIPKESLQNMIYVSDEGTFYVYQ